MHVMVKSLCPYRDLCDDGDHVCGRDRGHGHVCGRGDGGALRPGAGEVEGVCTPYGCDDGCVCRLAPQF